MMVNVEAVVFENAKRMGVGIVVRDHNGNGNFLAACIAIRRAILFASEMEFSRTIIATDCLSTGNKLKSKSVDRSQTTIIIRDIKQLVRSMYDRVFELMKSYLVLSMKKK